MWDHGGAALVRVDEFGPFDILSDRAHQLYVDGDPAAAVLACDQMFPLVRAAGDVATERFLSYIRGIGLRELGRYQEAVSQGQELLVSAGEDPMWRAKALALVAEQTAVLGRTSEALDQLAEAFDLVETHPGGYNRMSARMAIAITLEAVHLYPPADELVVDVLSGRDEYYVLALEEACALRAVWGAARELTGDEAPARRHALVVAQRAIALHRAATTEGDQRAGARAEVYLALALGQLGDHAAAWALVGDPGVMRWFSPSGVERLVALLVRGRAQLDAGDVPAARASLEEAERLGRLSRRDVWRWTAVAALARCDVAEAGDHPAVRRWRSHALALHRRLARDARGRASELTARRRVRQLLDERDGVHRAALADPLTGLGNRRALRQALEQGPAALGAVFVDVDSFKEVNDRYSHDVGDRVLCRVAELLEAACRSSELVARYGGDEFVVLVTQGTEGTAAAEAIAQRVHAAVRAVDWDVVAQGLRVTVSVGVQAHAPAGSVLAAADAALYAAKRGGRDRVVVGVGDPADAVPGDVRGDVPRPGGEGARAGAT